MMYFATVGVAPSCSACWPHTPASRFVSVECGVRLAWALEQSVLARTPRDRLANISWTAFFCFSFDEKAIMATPARGKRRDNQEADGYRAQQLFSFEPLVPFVAAY